MDNLNEEDKKEISIPKKKVKEIKKDKGDNKSKQISSLLKEYNSLTKKSIEGKGIRKKLRKLGYYLSQNKKKKESKKDKE